MKNIILRTLKDRLNGFIIYCLFGIALLWMYIGLFPSFSSQAEAFNELSKVYPEAMMKAFGIESLGVMFSNLQNFLSTEQFGFVWPLLGIALAIGFSSSIIAGEIERGNIELLLTQPISRTKIFWSKYISGIIQIAIFSFVTILAAIPLARLYNVSYVSENYWKTLLVGFCFLWAIFSLSILFSTIFNEKGKTSFISSGILIVMYVLKIVSSLKDNLKDLQYGSFFYYFDPSKVLVKGELGSLSISVFILTAIIATVLAVIWFTKRDIATN